MRFHAEHSPISSLFCQGSFVIAVIDLWQKKEGLMDIDGFYRRHGGADLTQAQREEGKRG
ncbi:hypothetical protein H8S21_02090 [Erwinia persicina]|uniref:hypothetical protein n=1 Tax=Erwinia persicina TaxID=55211 RepID=UPI001654B640|nr:hypothetical protein [Erwinia persicina]MBC3944108.1 hypothetical protein [Erwinia persicina]MBD8212938.1 hypothetical protein [Erwinia persicina]